MDLHSFLVKSCSHSFDMLCQDKSLIGRNIIESLTLADMGVVELSMLDDLSDKVKKNILYDVLHFNESVQLMEKLFLGWDKNTTNPNEMEYINFAEKVKRLHALCDDFAYASVILWLLDDGTDGLNVSSEDGIASKYKTALAEHNSIVVKQWIDEGYYHACDNNDCQMCKDASSQS